ncbi:MAG: hypothetical protein ACW97Z_16350 [Candidatus Hodarchaeales archaeon]|jgi:hypothetical protein
MVDFFLTILDILKRIQNSRKRRNWPSVEGVLEDYKIEKRWGIRTHILSDETEGITSYFQAIVIILYTVNGIKYTITDGFKLPSSIWSEEISEAFFHMRYVERDIQINYNPKNPQNAIVSLMETI